LYDKYIRRECEAFGKAIQHYRTIQDEYPEGADDIL